MQLGGLNVLVTSLIASSLNVLVYNLFLIFSCTFCGFLKTTLIMFIRHLAKVTVTMCVCVKENV